MKLYEINTAIRNALDTVTVDEETGEILNAEILHAVEAEATEKIEATALYLREMGHDRDALDAEIKRLQARKDSMKKKEARIKALLLEGLKATGKVKTQRVTVSIRKTTALCIDEGAVLPDAFTTTKTVVDPNKTAIKIALQSGAEVPFCHLEERESVMIR